MGGRSQLQRPWKLVWIYILGPNSTINMNNPHGTDSGWPFRGRVTMVVGVYIYPLCFSGMHFVARNRKLNLQCLKWRGSVFFMSWETWNLGHIASVQCVDDVSVNVRGDDVDTLLVTRKFLLLQTSHLRLRHIEGEKEGLPHLTLLWGKQKHSQSHFRLLFNSAALNCVLWPPTLHGRGTGKLRSKLSQPLRWEGIKGQSNWEKRSTVSATITFFSP